jgi:ferredoxin
MRLDVFLPFLKKPKKGTVPRGEGLLLLAARRVLPRSWLADKTAGKPGLARRWLKWLGPSWLSSPLRRASQALCLLLFLWLFFWVCYPYSARPSPQWSGWQPTGVNPDQTIELSGESAAAQEIAPDQTLFAAVQDPAGNANSLGQVTVVSRTGGRLTVRPAAGFSSAQLEQMQFDLGGPWILSPEPADAWPAHYADNLAGKEYIHAESLLIIDPLVALSTAIASRTWVWSLTFAAGILLAAVFIPRGFCGWICPLGTVIDLFDWAIGNRVTRLRAPDDGWWVHIKYYLLAGVMLCSVCGVLVSGYVAAIPVVTRGFLFLFDPLQVAYARGWHNVPPLNAGHFVSLVLFAAVLGLGFFKPRFWCKYVCPSGAVFSIGNLFRVSERKVEDTCINCNKCVEICPFDAIKPDFTTRTTDCTLCQTCGGVCPTHAIKFVERWNTVALKIENDPPTNETPLGRRGFLSLAAGSAAAVVGAGALTAATKLWGADLTGETTPLPVRPPGSLPEQQFLQACIRCGECFKACPNNVLQPLGFQQGLEGLWTPAVHADSAGCESSCNACGQVCPTGAIRALPLAEKKVARMGLAIVNTKTCLPFALTEACDECVKECDRAGYHAIEYTRVGTQTDETGLPVEGSGFLAPVVLAERCVGCGLCQMSCHAANVNARPALAASAIVVEAGPGKEDRLVRGSYIALREQEAAARKQQSQPSGGDYLPDFLK